MMEVRKKGIYKHYKGDYYIVEDIATHSETLEKYVVYRGLYGDSPLWVRPYDLFVDEVNQNKERYRFTLQEIQSVNHK